MKPQDAQSERNQEDLVGIVLALLAGVMFGALAVGALWWWLS